MMPEERAKLESVLEKLNALERFALSNAVQRFLAGEMPLADALAGAEKLLAGKPDKA
ncbi:MAG: hypothetical protein IOC71_09065 [Rhodobacter sp.]|nr:hypothetical protein [Rhodobacter sp.]